MLRKRVPWIASLCCLSLALSCDKPTAVDAPSGLAADSRADDRRMTHVLLISVDGLHSSDLTRFVTDHPASTLARLSRRGTTFTRASSAKPSDSFPGLLAMVTGGSPRSTGVYYDVSYDRSLSPPGSDCSAIGTVVTYDESIDRDGSRLDAGGGIDPAQLPRDPARGCAPVYPHQFLRVNTIFEVAKAAGLRTAWSDKHPAYDIVNGPSGNGVDDLYTPEIASDAPSGGGDWTTGVGVVEAYDDLKVQAILNEIDGKDHSGAGVHGIPAIFGMNFQAVSVGQKTAGYLDAAGTPSAGLRDALEHTDASLGQMVRELESREALESTVIIVSAKHGQSPIDPQDRLIVNSKLIPQIVNGVQADLVGQATEDDIALLWLTDQSKTADAVAAVVAHESEEHVTSVLSDAALAALFADPAHDSRAPDLIALAEHGVIYAKPTATKLAEHGGFSDDDTNVPILISGRGFREGIVTRQVETRQIAPTILVVLGLDPRRLEAVQREGTAVLPALEAGERERP